MASKALLLALMPKKGKGPMGMKDGKSDMLMGSESDDDAGASENPHEEAKSIFVDAAKDGDWNAAFDALMSCMGDMHGGED